MSEFIGKIEKGQSILGNTGRSAFIKKYRKVYQKHKG